MALKSPAHAARYPYVMVCRHQGFRTVCSSYDRERGLLVYFWTCERCGVRLHEAGRAVYRPSFDPRGNERVANEHVVNSFR